MQTTNKAAKMKKAVKYYAGLICICVVAVVLASAYVHLMGAKNALIAVIAIPLVRILRRNFK